MATRRYRIQKTFRTPPPVDGVDFNRCYNIRCENFASYPAFDAPRWGARDKDGYTLSNKGQRGGAATPAIVCRSCNADIRLVSNIAATEEEARHWPPLAGDPACSNQACENAGSPVSVHPERYQRFGVTDSGAQRYRCRACHHTLSVNKNPLRRLRQPRKTEEVLRLLVNKVPMRRLCDVAGINAPVLYQRIGLLYERLRSFARTEEERFLASAHFERIRVTVDRQDHPLAWGSAIDRQTFVLKSTVTADTDTSYILAQHVNYDPAENAMQRELESRALGDPDIPAAFRRYARLWLPHEGEERRKAAVAQAEYHARTPGAENIGLAGRGAFVHETYTLAGHFLFLRRWFERAVNVHLSLDQESAIDRICLLSFPDRVRDGSLNAFFVRVDKGLTVAKRQQEVARTEALLAEQRAANPGLSDGQLLRRLLTERYLQACQRHAHPLLRWVSHPYSTMQEPRREVLCLTDDGHRNVNGIVNGLGLATLRGVDRYFMQVRRKLSVLERPIRSASTSGRAWYGYNAYSPRVVMQLLEIFRVVYNFHLVGKDQRTPAERMGITSHRITLPELIGSAIPSQRARRTA